MVEIFTSTQQKNTQPTSVGINLIALYLMQPTNYTLRAASPKTLFAPCLAKTVLITIC